MSACEDCDGEDEHVCRECDASCMVPYGLECTGTCNLCAQRLVVELRAKLAAAEADRDKYAKHADEGWALANRRTEQWKQVEAERDLATRAYDDCERGGKAWALDAAKAQHDARSLRNEMQRARRSARAWKALAKNYRWRSRDCVPCCFCGAWAYAPQPRDTDTGALCERHRSNAF